MPAGEAVPLLGCLASRIDLSAPPNRWSVTVINPCLCCKDKHKCSSIFGAIIAETHSPEGRGFVFIHHTCPQQELPWHHP